MIASLRYKVFLSFLASYASVYCSQRCISNVDRLGGGARERKKGCRESMILKEPSFFIVSICTSSLSKCVEQEISGLFFFF